MRFTGISGILYRNKWYTLPELMVHFNGIVVQYGMEYPKPKKFTKKGLTVSEVSEKELKKLKYLNNDEYKNPYIVFENVFNRFTIEQVSKSFFDLILATMANSLYHKDYCCNVSMLNFHKMLDACKLIQQRDKTTYQ